MTIATHAETSVREPRFVRFGVVGCGLMGAGVAEIAARAGLDVRVAVSSEKSRERGLHRITGSLDRAVAKARISEADRKAALERISFTTVLEDLADRQMVVEAVAEDEPAKLQVFSLLDKVVEDPEAVLATNTSSLPIVRIARAAVQQPGRVVGVHFFNPVPVLPLVELVPSVLTDERTVDRAEHLVTDILGKTAIRSRDRAGFLVNALLFPFLLSAVRMVESGVTAEVIDRGMVDGCSHPMGPLRLLDLIGLDTTVSIAESLYAEHRQPHFAPPPLLLRMVEAGLLGRKTGRGFYSYP